jgi:hypothetical protein
MEEDMSISHVALVLCVTACLGAAAERDPATGQVSPQSPAWHALVIDGRSDTLLRLDPESSKPFPLGTAASGSIVELRDPSRLLIVSGDGTRATLFQQPPPRTVGPIDLGDDCRGALARVRFASWIPWSFGDRIIESVNGGRLMLSCETMLVSMNLRSGEVGRQRLGRAASLHLLNDQRLLTVSHSQDQSSTELFVYDVNTLAEIARIQANTHLSQPALVSGGREILLIENARGPGFGPMSLRYFDAATGAPVRATSMNAPFGVTRVAGDGRFVFASNMDRNPDKQTPRELRILAAETGELLERVELLEHSSWFTGDSTVPAIENRRFRDPTASRLLILGEGRLAASLPIHDFVLQLSVDEVLGRMFLLDGRSFMEYTWPALQLQKQIALGRIVDWGGQPSNKPYVAVAPGAARALVVSGGSAVALDLTRQKALPETTLGSGRARALSAVKNVGLISIALMFQSGIGSSGPGLLPYGLRNPSAVAFGENGGTALLAAPTGEVTMIDMITGRTVRHLSGGDAAMAVPGVPLVVAADKDASWVISAASGETVARFPVDPADGDAPLRVSVSADRRLVLIGRGSAVHLLDSTGKVLSEWAGLGRVVSVLLLRRHPD